MDTGLRRYDGKDRRFFIVKNDGSYSDVARAAHGPDTSHAGYKVYKMDNVDEPLHFIDF